MSLGSYNLTRYNLGGTPPPVYEPSYSMYAIVTASFDVGSLYTPTYFISQGTGAEMPLGWGYDIETNISQDLTATMTADELATPSYSMSSAMTAASAACIRISTVHDMLSAMTAVVTGNLKVNTSLSMSAAMTAVMTSCLGFVPVMSAYQSMDALAAIVSTRTTVMQFIDLEIPAGGKLVIDSDNYTVYLNDADAIHAYSGEWIKFGRNLQGVDVTSGTSGDIDVSILYTERYL